MCCIYHDLKYSINMVSLTLLNYREQTEFSFLWMLIWWNCKHILTAHAARPDYVPFDMDLDWPTASSRSQHSGSSCNWRQKTHGYHCRLRSLRLQSGESFWLATVDIKNIVWPDIVSYICSLLSVWKLILLKHWFSTDWVIKYCAENEYAYFWVLCLNRGCNNHMPHITRLWWQ